MRAVIAAADEAGVTAYGSFSTGTETDRRGELERGPPAGTRTSSQLITVSMGPDGGTGYAEAAAVDATHHRCGGHRPRSRGQGAGDRRTRSPIDAGDYPVVLEEYAVVDILDMLGYLGFSALAVQEERSFVEIGKRIGSRARDDHR